MMILQWLLTAAAVAAALVWTVFRLRSRSRRGKCGGCAGCPLRDSCSRAPGGLSENRKGK